jgi:hypothetical protein
MFSPLGSQRSFFSSTIHPQEARSIEWEVAAFCGRRPASVLLHFVSTEGFIPDDRGKTVTKPLALSRLGLLLSEKQIPQVVENLESGVKRKEALERAIMRPRQVR